MKVTSRVVVVALAVGLIVSHIGPVAAETKSDPKPFNWNFKDADLIQVIEAVAEYTGKNFNIDPKLSGKVTLITNREIPPNLAYQILESILASRGYALVPVIGGNMINVVPATEAVSAPIPTEIGKPPAPYENFVTQLVPVQFAQAGELASVLQALKSKEARIDAYAPANLLIITERASLVNRLVGIVKQIDAKPSEQEWKIIKLKFQSADTLAQEIMEVLSEEAAAAGGGQQISVPGARAVRPPQLMGRPGGGEGPAIVGAVKTPLRIVPDAWSNSLIIVAVKPMMEKVETLIKQLDVTTPLEEGNLHVYFVKNADVEDLAKGLESLISGTSGARREGMPQGGQFQGGQPGAGGAVQAFEKEVRISAYDPGNALLITACPQDWKRLEKLLKDIDKPEPQVYVEAVIMEVTISDDVTVGVDFSAFGEDDFIAASTFGKLANFIVQGPLGYTGGLIGVIGNDIQIRDPLTGEMVTVPKVPVLLTAIQTVTDLEVLSAPALLTTNNEESFIHVGKNIPVIQGTARPLAQEATVPTVYSSVNRQDIGIKLTVEPQVGRVGRGEGEATESGPKTARVGEGDYVKLKVKVEVSDTILSDVKIDPNISGPTLRKTEIDNVVVIQDGSTAIVGGLMSQKADATRSQVPILGDIPVLGFFFRQRAQTQEKRNLVVLLTPHIVTSGEEHEKITTDYRDEYEREKLNMRQDLGFWRKVFKKQKQTTDAEKSSKRAKGT